MQYQTGTFTASDGVKLATKMWTPDPSAPTKGAIILVHGYGEHLGRYQHVAAYFVQQGYSVHGMDSRGHGQSKGEMLGYFERFAQLSDDLAGFVKLMDSQRQGGKPLFILGHSMGGLETLHYLARYTPAPNVIRGFITSGALFDAGVDVPGMQKAMVRSLSAISPKSGVVQLDSSTVSKDQAVVSAYDSDPLVFHGKIPARVAAEFMAARELILPLLKKITLPALIMHGGSDRLVRPDSARWIYGDLGSPDKTLKIYEGLFHEILNEPERTRVMADIWVWLASHGLTGELKPR